MGAKSLRTRGKQSRPSVKVPNMYSVEKEVKFHKQPGGSLRGSYPLKSA
jgi:hypothetical protein